MPRRMPDTAMREQIGRRSGLSRCWFPHDTADRVNPARFFDELRRQLPDDGTVVIDDGNHTFLTAELMPIHSPKSGDVAHRLQLHGLCGTRGDRRETRASGPRGAAIVGDGAFMMTCMEILTAATNDLGIIYYVFNDGELAEIGQAQAIPYKRKPCTRLGKLKVEGVALATGAAYLAMPDNGAIADLSARPAKSPVADDR